MRSRQYPSKRENPEEIHRQENIQIPPATIGRPTEDDSLSVDVDLARRNPGLPETCLKVFRRLARTRPDITRRMRLVHPPTDGADKFLVIRCDVVLLLRVGL